MGAARDGAATPGWHVVSALAGRVRTGAGSGSRGDADAVVPEEVLRTVKVETLGAVADLPREWIDRYFPERMEARILDPQSLLTQARREGILHFLDFHFREARSTIHIMVLGPRQRLPLRLDLQAIHRRWFGDALSVLVIYHMGNPEMSRLIFGPEAERRIPDSFLHNAVLGSIDEAMVAANAEDQLERFLMELSRRLYWIEAQFHGEEVQNEAAIHVSDTPALAPSTDRDPTAGGAKRPFGSPCWRPPRRCW